MPTTAPVSTVSVSVHTSITTQVGFLCEMQLLSQTRRNTNVSIYFITKQGDAVVIKEDCDDNTTITITMANTLLLLMQLLLFLWRIV